jgi:hypothetical protein
VARSIHLLPAFRPRAAAGKRLVSVGVPVSAHYLDECWSMSIVAAAHHPKFHTALRNVALAAHGDKLRAIQDAAIELAPSVAIGEVLKCDAVDVLCVAARNNGLHSRFKAGDIEHVIGMGLEGIPSLMPRWARRHKSVAEVGR